MTIAFPCRHCGKTVNAPANMAGKRAACPFCKNVVDVPVPLEPEEEPFQLEADVEEETPTPSVPAPFQLEPEEEENASPVPAAESSASDKITVACEHCRKKIRLPAKAVGKKARCPSCKETFRVSAPVASKPKSESPAKPALKLKLNLSLPTKPPADQPAAPNAPVVPKAAPSPPVAQSNNDDDLFAFADEPAPVTPAVAALRAAKPKPPEPELQELTEEEPVVKPPAKPKRAAPQLLEPPDEEDQELTPVLSEVSLDALSPFADANAGIADLGNLAGGPVLGNSNPYASSVGSAPSQARPKKTWNDRGRDGLPWDDEKSPSGYFNTLSLIINDRSKAFSTVELENPFNAMTFCLTSYLCVGAVVVGLLTLAAAGGRLPPGYNPVFAGFFILVSSVVAPLISSIVTHTAIMITFSENRGFKATYIGYAYLLGGIYPLILVPCVGGLIYLILGIAGYFTVLDRIHAIRGPRAFFVFVLAIVALFCFTCCLTCGLTAVQTPVGIQRF